MNVKFQQPSTTFELIDNDPNHAKIKYGPLERGFSHTFGNSLRRVMLSSLIGAAVYAIKVDNVVHEFSFISGVLEKLTDIVINIKKLILKVDLDLFPENNTTTLTLKVTKAKKITAKNIKCPGEIEVVNKDLYLFTTTDNVPITIHFYVKIGRGYVSFLDNQKATKEARVISIDSLFSPIEQVSYKTEEIKSSLSQFNEYLILDVKTNGAINASYAVSEAINILISHYKNLNDKLTSTKDSQEDIFQIEAETEDESDENLLIEDLNFTYKTYNTLKKNGIIYLSEIKELTDEELLKFPSFGETCLKEVKAVLKSRNLKLKNEI